MDKSFIGAAAVPRCCTSERRVDRSALIIHCLLRVKHAAYQFSNTFRSSLGRCYKSTLSLRSPSPPETRTDSIAICMPGTFLTLPNEHDACPFFNQSSLLTLSPIPNFYAKPQLTQIFAPNHAISFYKILLGLRINSWLCLHVRGL